MESKSKQMSKDSHRYLSYLLMHARLDAKEIAITVFIIFSFTLSGFAGVIQSPFNNLILKEDTAKEYSFLLTGHLYGSQNSSVYPSASLLANIPSLNEKGADFMILLGDIVRQANSTEFDNLKKSFTSAVNFPVFNAPGNHDLSNRSLYIQHFGPTFFSFHYSSEFYIFLDSELSNGKIVGEQLDFFMKQIVKCEANRNIKNILILSHRLLWAIDNPSLQALLPHVNGPAAHITNNGDFQGIVLKLRELTDKPVYFISGDVGLKKSFSIFYEKDTISDITYVATGIGDTKNDAVIYTTVKKTGEFIFTPISLTGQNLHPIEKYNLEYWVNHFSENSDNIKQGKQWNTFLKNPAELIKSKYFYLIIIVSLFFLLAAFFKK